jgi:hypothetical protein
MKSTRQFIIEQVVVSVVFNFLLAFLLSWLSLRHQDTIPLSAPADDFFAPSMGGDLLVGSFILGVILTLVLTAVTRMNLRKKTVESQIIEGWSAKLPNNSLLRSLLIGLILTCTLGLVFTILLGALGILHMKIWYYIPLHAFYVGFLAWAVTVPVVKRALADVKV